MDNLLPGLIHGEALQSSFQKRSKKFDERVISASSKKALELKYEAELADGWSLLKRNKKSYKLKKDKPEDRQLEDDIWCLFQRMGFKELNADRNFSIKVGEAPARQLDIFAKDDETVFIVECTHAKDTGPKSVKGLIDKIQAIRGEIVQAIHAHYGKKPRLKVKWAIATRNIIVREADRLRAASAGIPIITDADLEYFSTLQGHLKTASRFQFLARYLQGEGVEGLSQKVPATRGKMGNVKFYSFLISPYELLKISYISHRSKTSNEDLATYQRLVKPNRLKSIAEYIDDGGKFPTNIVVNIRSQSDMRFDPTGEKFGDTETGVLHLPALYGCAWVIDGQHRLYGYSYSTRDEEKARAVLPVLAFENMKPLDEVDLFIKINTEQVKVKRNLVNEIQAGLNIEDDDPNERLNALCARIVIQLDTRPPFKGRIKTEADKKTYLRCITLTSLVDGLLENNLVGSLSHGNNHLVPGLLMDPQGKSKQTLTRAQAILAGYFGLFAEGAKDHWDKGDSKGGYLGTNLGTRALLLLLKKIVTHLTSKHDANFANMEPDEVISKVEVIVKPLIKFFQSATEDTVGAFRTGSSKHSVTQSCLSMMELIHEADNSFDPPDVVEFMKARDKEGTAQARDLILQVEDIIFEDILQRLQDKYGDGEKNFWLKGVPKSVRSSCDQRYNENKNPKERWHEMSFSDYSDIIGLADNWDLFKDHYNFTGIQKRSDALSWLGKLNRLRNTTVHGPRAKASPLDRRDVAFVRRVHELVLKHVKDGEKLRPKHNYLSSIDEDPERQDSALKVTAA